MSLTCFLMENVEIPSHEKIIASPRFKDAKGKPVEWEIKPISSAQDEEIRKECQTYRVQNGARQKELQIELYLAKLAAACTVYPNLKDKELQDSWKVCGDDNLLKAMLLPGELGQYVLHCQKLCGFDVTFQDEVDTAKK